jgi:hypothetical protein
MPRRTHFHLSRHLLQIAQGKYLSGFRTFFIDQREPPFAQCAAFGKMGSPRAFAALVTSGRFGKERRSLRRTRTGKTRDIPDFKSVSQI